MKKIKVAQVGTGHDHASVTFESMCNLSDCFDVIGIAECNPQRMGALEMPVYQHGKRYTVEELLAMDDLEAVAIETDEDLATEYAQKFVDRGVAVHLDKPGSAGVKSFTHLIESARAGDVPLQMGYMYRYNPIVQKSLEMVRSGKLGTIHSVEAHMSVHHPVEKRRWLEKYKGGMTYFLGCHLIDLMLQIQGTPQEILPMNLSTGIEGAASEDYGFVLYRYPQGLSFIKTCAWEYNGFFRRQLVICGSEGTIEIRPLEMHDPNSVIKGSSRPMHCTAKAIWKDIEKNAWAEDGEDWDSGPFVRYDAMMRDFARIVRREIVNPYSYDYELQLFKVLMQSCGIAE